MCSLTVQLQQLGLNTSNGSSKESLSSFNSTASHTSASLSENNGFRKRKLIGKLMCKQIIRKELAKGESSTSHRLKMQSTIKHCGSYVQGSVVKGVTFKEFNDSHDFFFHQELISEEERSIMLATPELIYAKSKKQMYASNPLNVELEEVKLFLDNNAMHRCQIKDIFCVPYDGQLHLEVNVKLIDLPEQYRRVRYESIYDYPQRIDYLQELPPEAKPARLYFGPHIPEAFRDDEVEIFFKELIQREDSNSFKQVKIMDYKDGKYYVDLIDDNDQSAANLIIEKFAATKFAKWIDWAKPKDQIDQLFSSIVPAAVHPPPDPMRVNPRFGAYTFFSRLGQRLESEAQDEKLAYVKSRLFKVMIIDWLDPNHITIQPQATEYCRNYEKHVAEVQNLTCIRTADQRYPKYERAYQVGEHIIFRNLSDSKDMGKWLRGVVVQASCYNSETLVIDGEEVDPTGNYKLINQLISEGKIDPSILIYLVRSVDYGFHCRRSHPNMRHLFSKRDVTSVGTWGLRCKLFGINVLRSEERNPRVYKFSESCREVMDSWIRERILSADHFTRCYALFRPELRAVKPWTTYDGHFEITLFFRFHPNKSASNARFDCLNCHLTDVGVASDDHPERPGQYSRIELDRHVVDTLARHNRLPLD